MMEPPTRPVSLCPSRQDGRRQSRAPLCWPRSRATGVSMCGRTTEMHGFPFLTWTSSMEAPLGSSPDRRRRSRTAPLPVQHLMGVPLPVMNGPGMVLLALMWGWISVPVAISGLRRCWSRRRTVQTTPQWPRRTSICSSVLMGSRMESGPRSDLKLDGGWQRQDPSPSCPPQPLLAPAFPPPPAPPPAPPPLTAPSRPTRARARSTPSCRSRASGRLRSRRSRQGWTETEAPRPTTRRRRSAARARRRSRPRG